MAFAIATLASTVIYAQSTTFGIRAGVNFQNITGKDIDGDKMNNKLKTGFNIGANAEIPIGIDFFVQPGVLFSTKGAKGENNDDKINLSYIEVPVNLIYKPDLGTGKLLLGFGPYVGFAVGGKYDRETGTDVDIEFENEITAAQAATGYGLYYKSFDAGANLLFGYETSSKLSIQLNAQLGLVKINPEITGVDDKSSWKNTGFGVSLGYRF